MGKLPAWQFILQLTRKISMPLLIMYIGGRVRESLYCTENNKTVSGRYSGMTKGYLLLPRERLQMREDKHSKSLRHEEAMRKQKWNHESKTEGLCVFLGTSVQQVCTLCCQNHIKRAQLNWVCLIRGSAGYHSFPSVGLNFWHIAHFPTSHSLSFLTVTLQGQPQICS